ncbi:hypothetical protein [Prauserella cavernicola]|uniref:Uncharacterized protein n=1 Tax=Prauserella cavernicola TaxID=2800127 RepID=A0A934V5H4_9PSEU|nr:hypothetical protein [Prauserella cavernicola]MBK1785155.1 hypothetical protein [Prauserella cavernicola]
MDTAQIDREAVRAHPALQRLIDLRNAGWQFVHRFNDEGEVRQINGLRGWPDGHVDGVRLRHADDAAAVRWDGAGQVVWQKDGGLAEVVDGLLSLPEPS